MASSPYKIGRSFQGSPLYIFYDCESTGVNIEEDRIIEVAAVLHTKSIPSLSSRELEQLTKGNGGHFTSLCHCTRPIHPDAAKVISLTLDDLRDSPPVHAVLDKLFDWIREKVTQVSAMAPGTFTPVLVAHSGCRLDYPLLFNEVDRNGSRSSLAMKFKELNLHYADSYTHFTLEFRNDHTYRSLLSEGMSMKAVYRKFLQAELKGHRALEDAQALCRIFTEGYPSSKMQALQAITLNQRGLTDKEEQITKMRAVGIKPKKAEEILVSGVTLEAIEDRCRRNPGAVRSEMLRLGITKPSAQLLDHFKNL